MQSVFSYATVPPTQGDGLYLPVRHFALEASQRVLCVLDVHNVVEEVAVEDCRLVHPHSECDFRQVLALVGSKIEVNTH